jgi:carboxypeptidase C (cathepsin A)
VALEGEQSGSSSAPRSFSMKKILSLVCILVFVSGASYAQDKEKKPEATPAPTGEIATTKQSVKINGALVNFTANAGTLQLRDEENKAIALFGFVGYTRDGVGDVSRRPVVFAYNGGPGSSSVWLHMGALGPKRVVVNDPGFTPAAPYRVESNDFSLLDVADLVMIDPVGTGLSVPVGEAKFADFWGVDQDIRSISLFIRQYLVENKRLNSPKYLLGESYGTFRSAGIMDYLQERGIAMNGVILVSTTLDMNSLSSPLDNDLAYLIYFPTYAATAWYYNKIPNKPASLAEFLEQMRAFTRDEYAPALFKGDRLASTEREAVAKKLASFSGLTDAYWLRANLRVQEPEFCQELLRAEGQTVGRLDARFHGINQDLLSQFSDYDPQSSAISPAFTAVCLNYLYNDLKINPKLNYQVDAYYRKEFKWDWAHQGNVFWNAQLTINTGIDLARAMSRNPYVKVLILNGYYDIATPFYGVEYTIDHLGLRKEIKNNIIMKYYEAGHMMYTHQPSLEKFKKDVAEFIQATSK